MTNQPLSVMGNSIARNIRHTALALIGACLILLFYISYLQIIKGESLAQHPLNQRAGQLAHGVKRGDITDNHGEKLARSRADGQGSSSPRREYPGGTAFAQVVGYDSRQYGQMGIESVANGQLSGFANPLRRLGPLARLQSSQAGDTVVLTLDANLQRIAHTALGQRKGSVVAIDPRSGAILVMISKPAFDPNSLDAEWPQISQSLDSPLLNRATQGLYPPGSIIKVLVAETALAEKITDLDRQFTCTGILSVGKDYQIHESNRQSHGKLNLSEALAQSCNITFGQLGLELGRDRLSQAFARYGIGQLTGGKELPENPDRLPEFSRLTDGDLAQTGIGQASLLVTPLKMAMLAATFANQGSMMAPYLIAKTMRPDGTVTQTAHPREWLKPVSPQRAAILRDMMVATVEAGTGTAARLRGISIAGKTGTAENPHGNSHAWFIGFAPADHPQIAVAIIVENGGAGGEIAAPIARQIIAQALR